MEGAKIEARPIAGKGAGAYNMLTMSDTSQSVYCISCGEEVPVKKVSIGIEGEELLQCVHCNSFLGSAGAPQTLQTPARQPEVPAGPGAENGAGEEFHPDETGQGAAILPDMPGAVSSPGDASGGLEQEGVSLSSYEDEHAAPPLKTVITVEDTELISAILNDMLVREGLTEKVISCKNGYEFLGRYVRARMNNTKVDLVVMDVKMPILNGISAAVAMRAHEEAQELPEVPILFFTSKRCDETFRKVLVHTAPAMYINKGASDSPDHLQDRIGKVVRQLLREEWA